jgi:hypothetical protein
MRIERRETRDEGRGWRIERGPVVAVARGASACRRILSPIRPSRCGRTFRSDVRLVPSDGTAFNGIVASTPVCGDL